MAMCRHHSIPASDVQKPNVDAPDIRNDGNPLETPTWNKVECRRPAARGRW